MSNKRIQKKHGRFWCLGCGHNKTYLHVKSDNFRSKRMCHMCTIDALFQKNMWLEITNENIQIQKG